MNDPEPLIQKLQEIRARNNVLWVGVIRLAMKHAPEEARVLFRQIERNDEEITRSIRDFYGPEEPAAIKDGIASGLVKFP